MHTFKSNSNILLSAFVLSILVSCATPQAIIRMQPTDKNVKWFYGQAFASDTLLGIVVQAAFERATSDYNIFSLSFTNNSNMDYLVDPSTFYFEDVSTNTLNPHIIKAIDPESILLDIDKQISQNDADIKNARISGAIITGTLVAATVALAVSDDDRPNHNRHNDPDLFIAAPIIIDNGNNYSNEVNISPLEQKRDTWETSTIRKTTLEPKYKVEGKIFFHRFEKPGIYNLIIPVDDQIINIQFMQLNFYPDSNK